MPRPPRHRDHEPVGHVVLADVALEVVLRERTDGLGRPDDRTAERVVGVEGGLVVVEDVVLGGVLVHLDLLDHDVLLLLDLARRQRRLGDEVDDGLKSAPEVLVQAAGVEARVLLRRERVEVAADGLHPLVDEVPTAPPRALEHHVLDKVRDAALGGPLVAAPGVDPRPDGDGVDGRDGLGEHADAVVEDGPLESGGKVGVGHSVSFSPPDAQAGRSVPPRPGFRAVSRPARRPGAGRSVPALTSLGFIGLGYRVPRPARSASSAGAEGRRFGARSRAAR